jgi:hypothetical protein
VSPFSEGNEKGKNDVAVWGLFCFIGEYFIHNMSRSWIEAIIESEDTFLSHGDCLPDGRPMGSVAIALNFESKQ